MSDAAARIKQELEGLNFSPEIEAHDASYPSVIIFDYKVKNGRYKGQCFKLGVSCQNNEMYPEYPPHFIHLSPAIEQPQDGGGIHCSYSVLDKNGKDHQWATYSRPPGPFWDSLATKSMKAYLEHITRFWNNI